MTWFLDLSTRVKLLLGFGVAMLFLAIVMVISYQGITAIRASQEALYEEEFITAVGLKEIRTNQNAIRANVLTMMFTNQRAEQEALHEDAKRRNTLITETIQTLTGLQTGGSRHSGRLQEYEAIRGPYVQTRETQIIPLIYGGRMEEAQRLVAGIQEERNRQMSVIANELVGEADDNARQILVQSGQTVDASIRSFLIAGALAFLLSGMTVWSLNRAIARPLQDISRVAERVASRDLAVVVPVGRRSDEIGVLEDTFRRMVANLREVTRDLMDGIGVLATSAAEITATTSQVASGAAETAAAISQTTTTIEEVKQTAQVASQKAGAVSESAQRAVQVAQRGRQSVSDTIDGIRRVQGQMESITESIIRLSEQGQAIGEIIAAVNDLAEQSNLLAVNAAIEAARAGDQGKGFAVVAQEIKLLADQSKQATTQVRTILGDVQKATGAAVMAAEQGSKAVESGVKQSGETQEAIRMLADNITEAAQAALQIAASSQQQLAGMDQVALAMENIKQASMQNAASTRQAEDVARTLHGLGQRLKEMVEQYRI